MSEVKIPEGYKQTEIGVIPEDWEVFNFGSLINYIKGCPFKSADYQHTGVRIIRVSDTSFTEIKDNNPIYISDGKAKTYKPWKLQKDDLIISTVGSKPPMYDSLVGKVIKVTSKHDGSLLNQNALRVRAKSDTNGIQSLLLGHFRTERYIDFIERIYRGNANQASITLQSLFEFKIPLPESKKEQTAIATALSDVDNLIQSLEKLIAKKEAIKTGTMQQLLTGKTRLPEFATREDGSAKGFRQTELGRIPEDWGIRTVFELAERNSSNFNDGDWVESEHIINNGIRLLQTGNIGVGYFVDKGNKKYISEHSFIQLNCKLLEVGDLLICRLAEPAGRACIFKGVEEDKAITSVDVTIFRPPTDSVNREFYLHVFSSSDWFNSINEQVGGTTHKRISRSALGSIYVPYPTYQEQTAIAFILSDMDAEIQALQERLDKTRDIKQGMMQQLLTGKVRLAH